MANLTLYRKSYSKSESSSLILDYNGISRSLNSFHGTRSFRNFTDMNGVNEDSGKFLIKSSWGKIDCFGSKFFVGFRIVYRREDNHYGLEARVFDFNKWKENFPPQLYQVFEAVHFPYTCRFSGEEVFSNAGRLSLLQDLFQHYENENKRRSAVVIA